MEKYVVVTDNTENTLVEIHADFLNKFRVDLDDERYVKISGIEEKWDAIIKSCFGDVEHKIFRNYVEELYGFMEWVSIREMNAEDENEEALEEGAQLEKEIFELINKYQGFVRNYSLYEMDVWIEALFSIKYIESKKRNKKATDENRKNFILQGTVGLEKEDYYRYPLEKEEEIFFCESCVTEVIEKYKRLFLFDFFKKDVKDSQKGKIHFELVRISNNGYIPGIECRIPYDKDFTRWSYKKILDLEKSKNFLIEDRIFYQKIIKSIFVRNVINCMWKGMNMPLSDYWLLFHKLNELNSFSWQNFIGLLYVEIYRKKWFINPEKLNKELLRMFEGWIRNIKEINAMQNLLIRGFVYIYYNHPHNAFNSENFGVVEKKAYQYLNALENDNSVLEELMEGKENKKLRTKDKNDGIEWDYAILQMGMISGIIPESWRYEIWEESESDRLRTER